MLGYFKILIQVGLYEYNEKEIDLKNYTTYYYLSNYKSLNDDEKSTIFLKFSLKKQCFYQIKYFPTKEYFHKAESQIINVISNENININIFPIPILNIISVDSNYINVSINFINVLDSTSTFSTLCLFQIIDNNEIFINSYKANSNL
jgi:hypothetical protein